MSDGQRKELIRGEFGAWKLKQSARHVAPFWWVEPPPTSQYLLLPPHPRVRNGTAFFAKIDNSLFCITAAHVYRGYLEAKERFPGLPCLLGEGHFIFDAESNFCSIGGQERGVDKVDIATFRMTEEVLIAIGKEPILASWPPYHPFSGQQATILGYPGVARLWIDETSISFGLYVGSTPVGSAGDSQITFPFNREYWIDSLGSGLPPVGLDLGGISGGPVLFPTELDRDWTLQLGGVISEMPSSADFELVTAVPAHFIAADGKVLDERSAPVKQYIRPAGR